MTAQPQIAWLPGGGRLHMHHGPIDLIVEAQGEDAALAYARAAARFQTILAEICTELPGLRQPVSFAVEFDGPTARRMQAATRPHLPVFVTPMATVAGSVADEILAAICKDSARLTKAHVNNGGDIAFHLSSGATIRAQGPAGHIVIGAQDTARGIATSGWHGRSHSLGIADAVTVAARSAAAADAAATLIANAVDLPGHPAVSRAPACELSPDSDLGQRLVTTGVGPLSPADIAVALDRGEACAHAILGRGLICQAVLSLGPEIRAVSPSQHLQGVPADG